MTTTLTLDNVINGLNVGGTLNVSGLGVLAPDQSLGSLTVTAVGLSSAPTETSFTSSVTIQGAYGTLVMQADGSYSYTASSNISFTNTNGYVQDSFVFTAGNSSGAGQATLTITVTPSGVQYVGAAPGSTVTVGNAATVVDASLGNVTVNAGNGNDTFILGTGDKLTAGNGTDTVAASTATNASITLGNGNDTVVAGSGDQVTLGNGNDTVTAASNDQIALGNGTDTVTAASNDQIKVGNGTDTITAGSNDQITAGNGTDTVTAGSNDQITLGNGTDTVTAASNDQISLGNGTDNVTVGMDSSVALGNGTDTVKAGNDTTVSVGNGSDTITDGTGGTVTAGNGTDTITTGIGSTDTVGNGSDTISTGVDSTVTQKATTTGTAATVLNLNLLDSDGSNDTGGTEIVTLQEVASALFPATTTPQLATLAKSFWNNQLLVTFRAGPSSYYTLWGTSTGYFSIATSDQHGNLTGPVVSNSSAVSSSSVFLAAIANLQLAGLTSSSLLVGTEVQNLTGTNVVQGLANNPGISNILQSGPGADVLVGGSAPDTFAHATCVLVDGVDLAMVDLAWLRRQIGVVLQENVLFNGTVRENIALADPTMPMERVIAAAMLAGAHEFVLELPEGYDTIVGERGSTLSGGQRQRIAIARALITNPRILIFDEATSALDYESERAIHQNMKQITAGRTVFIIAHRLSTVRNADRIITIERGRIVEDGKHDDLIRSNGRYAKLHYLQAGIHDIR